MIDYLLRHSVLAGILMFALLNGSLIGMTILGFRLGRRIHQENAEPQGTGTIEASVVGLFGLLVAFTFYGAADRFQDRRTLILDEAKAISTAWSRLDLLPEPAQSDLRDRFRRYLDAKLSAYANIRDRQSFLKSLAAIDEQGNGILKVAAAACMTEKGQRYVEVIMPAVNDMSDISMARHIALQTHPPLAIYILLYLLSLGSALLVSAVMSPAKKRSWIHLLAFCLMVSSTLYVTVDLELPRFGLIRVDKADDLLRQVRASMN